MDNSEKHTPLPWKIDNEKSTGDFDIVSDDKFNWAIATLPAHTARNSKVKANAAFIVKACNNHDALLEALEDLIDAVPKQTDDADWWEDELTHAMEKAKTAIKNAE